VQRFPPSPHLEPLESPCSRLIYVRTKALIYARIKAGKGQASRSGNSGYLWFTPTCNWGLPRAPHGHSPLSGASLPLTSKVVATPQLEESRKTTSPDLQVLVPTSTDARRLTNHATTLGHNQGQCVKQLGLSKSSQTLAMPKYELLALDELGSQECVSTLQ